jgi:exopolyphosphatase/guanosine-5'-triphosphate,3'-diphosphate pyrophosphatase
VAITKRARALYELHRRYFDVEGKYERILETAARLSHVGRYINIYKFNKLGEAMILNELNYGFTHFEIMTIATLVRYSKNKLPPREDNELLPAHEALCWLSFIISLSVKLNANSEFELKGDSLYIRCDYVIAQELENLQSPQAFTFGYRVV